MLVSYLFCAVIGVLVGTITGILPGVHINLVATVFVALWSYTSKFLSVSEGGILLFTAAVAHNVMDNIPSTFLGVPSGENVVNIVPAHRLLQQGRGLEVLRWGILGVLGAIGTLIILGPVLFFVVDDVYALVQAWIPYVLLGVMGILVIREEQKIRACVVTLSAGILGVLVFALGGVQQPLLPLLSGLFGISTLLVSWNTQAVFEMQKKQEKFLVEWKEILGGAGSSLFASVITSFLPGLSSSHTSLLATSWIRNVREESLIFITNFCNTAAVFLSLLALMVIEKARSGVVVALTSFWEIDLWGFLVLAGASLFVMVFVTFLCLRCGDLFLRWMRRIKYQFVCVGVMVFLACLTLVVSGVWGLLVLVCACAVGLFAHYAGVSKNLLMACIMLPVALYLLV